MSITQIDKPLIDLAIGSLNPVKINSSISGATKALSNCIIKSFEGFNSPSGVPDQPNGVEETLLGAKNRALHAWGAYFEKYQKYPDYSIGLEGGILKSSEGTECFAWMVVYNGIKFGTSKTSTFYLPKAMVKYIDEGKELGEADDLVFGTVNSKQSQGTVGHLTNGFVDRTAYYEQAIILAFIPFIWPDLY